MIIVLGPGRSGTSTVARILHNYLDIPMGTRFRSPDNVNPQGYFEDLDFRNLNHLALSQRISFAMWHNKTSRFFNERQEPWGFKDPRICQLYREYSKYIGNAQFIVAMRQPKQIIRSMVRHYHWSEEESNRLTIVRLHGISELLKGREALYIDFSVKRSDQEIVKLIKNFLR